MAMGPGTAWSTGTSRVAMTDTACLRHTSPRIASIPSPSPSLGRNTRPVPYLPASGTGTPRETMNLWGTWTMIPAPSPLRPSPLTAPRCSMFSSTRRPLSTILWDLEPSMLTTIPTPQLSLPLDGSKRPAPDADAIGTTQRMNSSSRYFGSGHISSSTIISSAST